MTHTTIKAIKNAYNTYLRSTDYSLSDCYSNYSSKKEKAFDYCKSLAKDYNGKAVKIIGHSCHIFSVGFLCTVDNRPAFAYITPSYDRYIYLDEI